MLLTTIFEALLHFGALVLVSGFNVAPTAS